MWLYLWLYLPILGSDVLDEGRGDGDENLDVPIGAVEGIEFLRLFEEQLLEQVEFLPDIVAEPVDGLHENGSVADVFVEGDDSLESVCVGVHLGNFVGEVILVVDCLVHLDHLELVLLEASGVAVRHGILVLLVLRVCLRFDSLYYQRSLQFF